MFCAHVLIFSGTEGVGSRFLFLRTRTRFRRYGGRRIPFSCLARPDLFSTVPRASGTFFMYCSPEIIFSDIEGVGFLFNVLRFRTRFRRYRGRPIQFACSALPDLFSAVSSASGPNFMFCAPVLIFSGTEGVVSRFHVLRARTRFRRYRGRRLPFSCFALPDSFSALPRASCLVFMFCTRVLIFGGTEVVGFLFDVLRARTRFGRYGGRRVPFSWFACP
jgi:hypothetical protein